MGEEGARKARDGEAVPATTAVLFCEVGDGFCRRIRIDTARLLL